LKDAMSDTVRIIVGLGNPGPEYAANRHNVGFLVVEELARRLGLTWTEGGPWRAATGVGPTGAVALVEPLTYMNRSGRALAAWAEAAGVVLTGEARPDADPATGTPAPEPVGVRPLIVCDDLNLPLGSVRLRARGRSGGQNGLASVIENLGGEEIPRLRLGVAPLDGEVDPADWADFVLTDFAAEEKEAVLDLTDHAASALEHWLDRGFEATVSRFNRRIRPEPDPDD
jgi:PTH1 family peptidyl-tRNA hydrolase